MDRLPQVLSHFFWSNPQALLDVCMPSCAQLTLRARHELLCFARRCSGRQDVAGNTAAGRVNFDEALCVCQVLFGVFTGSNELHDVRYCL